MTQPNDASAKIAFIKALVAAQSEFKIVGKEQEGRFKYANYADLINSSRDILTKNGFSIMHSHTYNEGITFLVTRLYHIHGHFEESLMPLYFDTKNPQSMGIYTTYAKRYAYAALIGLGEGKEDDFDDKPISTEKHLNNSSLHKDIISDDQYDQLEIALSKLKDPSNFVTAIYKAYKITTLADLKSAKFDYVITSIKDRIQLE